MLDKTHYIFFYFIPVAGLLANISVLIMIYFMKKSRQYWFSLALLYSGAIGFNLFQFISFITDSPEIARSSYFYYYTVQLLMTNSFLLFSLEFTNRNYNQVRFFMTISLIFSFLWLLLLFYSFVLTDNYIFIIGLRKFEWGFYPIVGYGTYLTNVYWLYIFFI